MAKGKSSVAIGCHCDDNEDPFPRSGWYSNSWHCEFVLLSALSGSYNVLYLHLIAVVASEA